MLFIYLFLSQKHDMYMKIFQTESSQIINITASIVVAISYFTLHILYSYERAHRIHFRSKVNPQYLKRSPDQKRNMIL